MRRAFLIYVIIIFLFNYQVFCQANDKITFGLKMGIVATKSNIVYNYNAAPKNSGIATILFGGVLNIPIKKNIVFQPGVLFVYKGLKSRYPNTNYDIHENFNYIEVPINFLYYFKTNTVGYFIGGGLAPAFKKNRYNSYPLKTFDLGINAITGYKFAIGASINVAYTYGILNVSQYKSAYPVIRNRYFTLSIGYEF